MKPFSRGWPGRCRPSSPTAPIQSRGTGSARPSPEELKSQFDRWLGRKLVVHYSSDLNPIEKVFAKLKGSRLSRPGQCANSGSSRPSWSKAFADFVEPIHDYLSHHSSRIMVFDILLAARAPPLPLPTIGKNSPHMSNRDLQIWFSPALPFARWIFSRH